MFALDTVFEPVNFVLVASGRKFGMLVDFTLFGLLTDAFITPASVVVLTVFVLAAARPSLTN
jgi:hypothetical protein